MLVAHGFVRTLEDGVAPVAHAGHQRDAEEPTQSKDRLAFYMDQSSQTMVSIRSVTPLAGALVSSVIFVT
jgi:hypothetical protein